MSHVRPTHPEPPNTEPNGRDYAATWPVDDRNELSDWVSRLNEAAHLLARIGRHSNTWRAHCALREVAEFLSSGANPDEREVILRALVAPVPRDGVIALDPNDLSFAYRGEGGRGVEIAHVPTGIVASYSSEVTRARNSAAAASRLAVAVDEHRNGPLPRIEPDPR